MALNVLLVGVILILCLVLNRLSSRFGIPVLLFFLLLGMVFGPEGLVKISFRDFMIAEKICSLGLLFIIFYGGFSTNWKVAKPVVFQAISMSSLGVIFTTLLTGIFCTYILKIPMLESFLLASVIGSTDSASVFSILRARRLNLKNGLASLLEVESGSNDPIAYSLIVIFLSLLKGGSDISLPYLIFAQVVYGIGFGFAFGFAAVYLYQKIRFGEKGLHTIYVIAVALVAYSLPMLIHGNGYLSAYIVGLIMGNSDIRKKVELVNFFDGVTWLIQILIFFLLGLLSLPSKILPVFLPSLAITAFMGFVARPLAGLLILTPYKMPLREQTFVSVGGLRGASSIVFAIFAVASFPESSIDIFQIVFSVSLISVGIQGSILDFTARKLDLIDNKEHVLKTFTDYQADLEMKLVEIFVSNEHKWCNKSLQELDLPKDFLVVMIKRGKEVIIPRGNTLILEGDILVVNTYTFPELSEVKLTEKHIRRGSSWIGKQIKDLTLSNHSLIVLVKRDDESIIPRGDTIIEYDDTIVMTNV